MSKYVRKTKDEYWVEGYYCREIGWECVTIDETMEEARKSLKDYRENEPYQFRITKHRVKKG